MNLDYSEEQRALADLAASICADHCPVAVVRAMENDPTGYPGPLWEQLARAGLLGVLVPEQFGGNPVSMLANASLYQQFGRALAPLPHFVSCVVGALALRRTGDEHWQQALLPGIADGSHIVTIAWLEPGGGYHPGGVQLRAVPGEGQYRLSGEKRHVFYASAAGHWLVLARTGEAEEAIDLFVVERDSPGLTLHQEFSMAGETQYRAVFDEVRVPAANRLTREDGWALWQAVLHEAVILDAARTVGLAERALEITTDYAKTREQFDKPLGAFQAIAHYLADCSTELEGARTLVFEAAWAHSQGQPYQALAAMAQLFAGDTARTTTARAQQIHGGIGFTLEYDIQLYFRRAKQAQLNWWDSHYLEQRIADAVLGGEPIATADPFL